MSTPTTSLDGELEQFIACLRRRLEAGSRTYGNRSFERPIAELIDEVMDEAVDICGWSFLGWVRLARLRDRVVELEQRMGGRDGA